MNIKPLHNNKNSGFKTPQDYFKNFDELVLNEVKLKSEISNNGFKTPDKYFENFEVSVEGLAVKETKVISIFNKKNVLVASSIAAAILIFFNLNIYNNPEISLTDLDNETVTNYILNEAESDELASIYTNNTLKTSQFINYSISDETLNSYLEYEDVNNLFSE